MEWIREWAFAVCSASVFCAALSLLVPNERYEKIINMCISVFILLVAVSPFAELDGCVNAGIEIDEYDTAESALDNCIEEQTERYLAATAEELIAARLAENGIFAEEISVSMDSSENGCISIGQVTITMNNADGIQRESVRILISQLLGMENIQVTGGNNEPD